MNEFLKYFHSLMAKGFASAKELAKLKELSEDLDGEDAEDAADKVAEAETLPTEEPTEEGAEGEDDETSEKMLSKVVSKAAAEAMTGVFNEFKKYVGEQKEASQKRAGLYHPEVASERKAANKRVYKFLQALQARDYATLKDLTGGTPSKGGYTIDPILEAEINHLTTEYGVARREMRVVPMRTRQLLLNRLTNDVDVYWTDEAGAKTSDDITIGQVALNLKKLSVIVPWTDELAEDTEIDIIRFLAERIAENIAKKEDQAFFNGDGSGTYAGFTGILNAATGSVTITGTGFTDFDADDLLDMIDALPQGAQANAKFFMHRTIMSVVRRLKDSEGAYIYQRPAEGGPDTIWGRPVVLVEAMPTIDDSAEDTPFIVYGDLRKAYWVGVHVAGMKMDISNEATIRNTADDDDINLFRQDMSALRVVQRVGGVTVLPSAAVVLKTAAASA